jgi:PAS domain S-box-containing protein
MEDTQPSPHRLNELLAKTTRAAFAASTAEGPDVFGRLAEQLADILGVSATMIATQVAVQPGFMFARATWLDGQRLKPFEYNVAHTPCRAVMGRQSRFVASGLHDEFAPGTLFHTEGFDSYAARSLLDGSGRQLGLIVAMDRAPMSDAAVTEAVLQIFAVRASAELERERGEAALRASEASYRSIFEANEDAIFVHDWATGAILDVSPKASELFGYPREQLQRMRVGDISANVPPYTEQDAVARIEQAKGNADPVRFEWRARHRAGHLMWHEVTLKRAEIAGEPRVLAFVRDITERKRAEEKIRASEEQYRAIFNASVDAMVLWDSDLRRVDINPAYEHLFGLTREQVLAGIGFEHHPVEYTERRRELVRRTLAGERCQAELESVRKDGRHLHIEVRTIPIQHRGKPHVLAIVRDITERRQAEDALRASEEQYRAIFNASVDGLLLWDADHRIVDINEVFLSLHGYRRDELIGLDKPIFIPPDLQQQCFALLPRIFAGEPCRIETRSRRKKGEEFDVEIHGVLMQYQGRPHVLIVLRDVTERRRTEERLRASEEQYRVIFDGSADALALWNKNIRMVDVNAAMSEMYGYTREEVIGRSYSDRMPRDAVDKRVERIRLALAGQGSQLETIGVRKDGVQFDVELRFLPIAFRGEPHVLVIARDITERKRAEDALRASEEQYRAIFNASADALVLRDADFRVVDVNTTYETLSGYSRNEVLGAARVLTQRDNSESELRRRQHDQVLRGETLQYERSGTRKDGSRFDSEVRLRPVQYQGKPHVLYIARDISDRKRAENALRASEEQYRSIFNASADALVLRDADFRIVDVNATYEAMTGLSREEVLGADRVLANPPEVNETIRPLHQKALSGEPIVLETQLVRRDGVRYDLELRGVPIQHRGAPHVLYMGRDITARRHAEDQQRELQAQLRQVQKMEAVGQLTGGIAHDFNNILAAIMGYVGLALERPTTAADTKLAGYLEQAEQGCRRARDLIQQMLAFSRGRRGERRALPLAALVDESLRLLRATFPSSIVLEVEAADEAAVAEVDPVQLQQVLLNLGINARDAIGSTGRIRFGVRHGAVAEDVCASCGQSFSGTFNRLWVTDSGPGISPQLRNRIFEPFFSTKAPGHGTGMGLATVHRIVHDHGGHLLVESDGGARFEVLLPAGAVDAAAPEPEAAAVPEQQHELLRGRVLLVDDEESVLGFMRELLQSWGLDVVAVRQSPAARDLLAPDGPALDLLLTDQTMPELSGVDLAHAAQSLRPDLPVLLYSGHADLIDVEALKRTGIRRVLRKPLEPTELRSAIKDCLPARLGPAGAPSAPASGRRIRG